MLIQTGVDSCWLVLKIHQKPGPFHPILPLFILMVCRDGRVHLVTKTCWIFESRFQRVKILMILAHTGIHNKHFVVSCHNVCCSVHCALLRFQVKTKKSVYFRYYRFNSPRILSKLLMSNEGGCGHQYPGIGNIAFVKDLMSRKITTRNFDCSRFGASIAPGLGWVCVLGLFIFIIVSYLLVIHD